MKNTNQIEKELIAHLVAGGSPATTAQCIARELQVMAAMHLKTCLQNIAVGLSKAEEIAQTALERAIKEKAMAMPGVQDVEFRYDARGVTVGLHFDSGESNSFVGRGWWIVAQSQDVAEISDDYLDEYAPTQAKYVSLWDGDTEVVTDCLVDTSTGQVWPETAEDIDHLDLEILESQVIRLADGTEFEIEEVDDKHMVTDLVGLQEATCAPYAPAPDSL